MTSNVMGFGLQNGLMLQKRPLRITRVKAGVLQRNSTAGVQPPSKLLTNFNKGGPFAPNVFVPVSMLVLLCVANPPFLPGHFAKKQPTPRLHPSHLVITCCSALTPMSCLSYG